MLTQVFKTPTRKRKTKTIDSSIQDFMNTCSEALKVNDDVDEYKALGISFAAKLKKMDNRQQIMAELLVNKVLSKGLLNQLTENTDIIENCYIHPNFQSSTYPGYSQISTVQDPVYFNTLNNMTKGLENDDSCSSVSTL